MPEDKFDAQPSPDILQASEDQNAQPNVPDQPEQQPADKQPEQPAPDTKPDKQPAKDRAGQPDKANEKAAEAQTPEAQEAAWQNWDLPQGVRQEVLSDFQKIARDQGLDAQKAQAIAKWQLDYIAKQEKAQLERGLKDLRQEWGQSFETNCKKIINFIDTISEASGQDLHKVLDDTRASLNPSMMRILLCLADRMGEDSNSGSQGSQPRTETVEEGLRNALQESRKKML